MLLYFSPMACSLASRIVLYEAGADATFVEVDPRTKRTQDGRNYQDIHALGMVPALELPSGEVVTENAAVLQRIAELHPHARLEPADARERTELHCWLSFIATELHKTIFQPLLEKAAPTEVKAYALTKVPRAFAWLDSRLEQRPFLISRFSVADAYAIAVLTWTAVTPIDLSEWPAVQAYKARLAKRPSVSRALEEERRLYAQQLARYADPPPVPIVSSPDRLPLT